MKRSITTTITIVVVVGIILLYKNFDPTFSHFAPKCPFHLLTGYECPSCGIQRAAHALLNGDFDRAFWLNPFLVLAMPYLLLMILTSTIKSARLNQLREILRHNYILYGYVALYFIWWIVRNTMWWQKICENIC